MSEILNGWRNICSTFAPKLSCIGGKTIMVGAGIKSSFRCKKKYRVGDKHLLNFGAKTKPHWRETRPLFPMSKMLHGKRNIRLTLAPNTIVYKLPFLILPMWNSRFGTSFFFPKKKKKKKKKTFFFFFFFFFLPMPKVGGAVYTRVRFIQR